MIYQISTNASNIRAQVGLLPGNRREIEKIAKLIAFQPRFPQSEHTMA